MNIRKRGNDSQLRWGRGSSRELWWGSKAQALDSYRFVRNPLLWFLFHGLGPHSRVLVQSVPSSAQQRAPCPLKVLRRHTSSVPQTVHANRVLCYQLLNNKNEKRTEFSPMLEIPMCSPAPAYKTFVCFLPVFSGANYFLSPCFHCSSQQVPLATPRYQPPTSQAWHSASLTSPF